MVLIFLHPFPCLSPHYSLCLAGDNTSHLFYSFINKKSHTTPVVYVTWVCTIVFHYQCDVCEGESSLGAFSTLTEGLKAVQQQQINCVSAMMKH